MTPILWFLYLVATSFGLVFIGLALLLCWFLYGVIRGLLTNETPKPSR